MKTILGFFLFTLVSINAEFPKVLNMNDVVDKAYEDMNREMLMIGAARTPIPNGTFNDAQVSNGSLIGLNTFKRTGDCWLTVFENGTKLWEDHHGMQLAILTFGRVAYGDEVSSAALISHRNSIYYRVEHNFETCKHKVLNYEFEDLAWQINQFPKVRETFYYVDEELNKIMAIFKKDLEELFIESCKDKKNSTSSFQDLSTPPNFLKTIHKHYSNIITNLEF